MQSEKNEWERDCSPSEAPKQRGWVTGFSILICGAQAEGKRLCWDNKHGDAVQYGFSLHHSSESNTSALTLKMGRVRAGHFVGVQGFVGASSFECHDQDYSKDDHSDHDKNGHDEFRVTASDLEIIGS